MKHNSLPWTLALTVGLGAGSWIPAAVHGADVRPVNVRALDESVSRERTFFVGTGASAEEAVELRESLIEAGARNVNLIVPDMVIVCDLPAGAAVEVPAAFASGPFARVASANASWEWIVDAYRTVDERARAANDGGAASEGTPGESFRDVVVQVSPERAAEIQREIDRSRMLRGVAPEAQATMRNFSQGSEFLGGTILANFILPESNGAFDASTEDWSDEDVTAARQGAFEGMLSWQARWPKMDMSFTMNYGTDAERNDTFIRVPIRYEPILHTMGDDHLWIMETMQQLGYNSGTTEAAVHEFNEDQRARFRTQWVFTAFIACSRNVETHRFGGGTADYTAYAYLGGPYMVEPFPAGTDPNLVGERLVYSQIVQHEAGHNFWTLDEYPGAPGVCASTSGYLRYENRNVSMTGPAGEVRCQPLAECIMHTAARKDLGRPWCGWSEGHLGVIDNNDNGYPDIFEARPEIVFAVDGPETVLTNSYTLRFQVRARAVPNQNPNIDPSQRVNYAVPLRRAWISIGSQSQVQLKPVDGDFDELVEDFEFHISVPTVGISSLGVMAENKVGYKSEETGKLVYFTGVNYSRTALTVRPERIDLNWEIAADPFGAKFDVYRLESGDPAPQPGDSLLPGKVVATNVPPQGPGSAGFVPYRFVDRDVVPGHEYRYYVVGVFSLPYGAGTREYHSPSAVVGQTAMLPFGNDAVISNVAPNPSRGVVQFSVNVPRTYGGPARAPVRMATPLEISVFNVRGQLVRNLRRGSEFSDVVTLRWDGTDAENIPAPSGVYFVRANAGTMQGVQKIVLVR